MVLTIASTAIVVGGGFALWKFLAGKHRSNEKKLSFLPLIGKNNQTQLQEEKSEKANGKKVEVLTAEFMLPVPIMHQKDPRRAYLTQGNNKQGDEEGTIGEVGCLITDIAMYLSAIGRKETPATVNAKLTNSFLETDQGDKVNGYESQGFIHWARTNKILSLEVHSPRKWPFIPTQPETIHTIKRLLVEGRPVFIEVDSLPGGVFNQHFALAVGYNQNILICNDPWTGQQVTHQKWGGNIYSYFTYKKKVA